MKSVIVSQVCAPVSYLSASVTTQATPSTPAVHMHICFTDTDSFSSKPKFATKSDKDKEARWNSHAWYYLAVTLNQIVLALSVTDRVVACTLVDMYFKVFEEILGSKANADKPGNIEDQSIGPPRRD